MLFTSAAFGIILSVSASDQKIKKEETPNHDEPTEDTRNNFV